MNFTFWTMSKTFCTKRLSGPKHLGTVQMVFGTIEGHGNSSMFKMNIIKESIWKNLNCSCNIITDSNFHHCSAEQSENICWCSRVESRRRQKILSSWWPLLATFNSESENRESRTGRRAAWAGFSFGRYAFLKPAGVNRAYLSSIFVKNFLPTGFRPTCAVFTCPYFAVLCSAQWQKFIEIGVLLHCTDLSSSLKIGL